MSVSPSYIMQ